VDAVTVAEVTAGAGPVGDVRVDAVVPQLVDELLPLADRWVHGSPDQVAELRRWLRLDRREPRYRLDGLTSEALALHVPAHDAEVPERVGEPGRALLRIWLAAQRHGLHIRPLSQLIDAPGTAPRLHEAVSGPDDVRRVLSAFRIGRPTRDPVSSARIRTSRQVEA